MVELSPAARSMCVKWFSFGEKATLTSSKPHAYVLENRAVFDEMIEKKVITVQQIDKTTFEYRGSPTTMDIAHEIMKETRL